MIVAFPAAGSVPTRVNKLERRRVVVIGAGAAGLTAALTLGEHSLLIEQRSAIGSLFTGGEAQGGYDDRSSTFPLGLARSGLVSPEDRGEKVERRGIGAWERQAIARLCASSTPRQGEERCQNGEPITVARWDPPALQAGETGTDESCGSGRSADGSLHTLATRLRGELRLATQVCKIVPSTRVVELADGASIVYDKLISSVNTIDLIALLGAALPDRVRTHQAMLYWLSARDIELVDDSTQLLYGDISPFAAGRRVGETVKRALAEKFRPATQASIRRDRLFTPRLVRGLSPGASAR